MGSYFASRGMAPFGSSSLLTVDLGQQYVDFFAYLRTSLLHHPASLLYSFSKGLGGEMWGTNAYYLLSPLNLVLLLFPHQWLTSGIMVVLLLKYGLAALSFGWLLKHEHLQTGSRLIIFTTGYAMMGWMIANQLNLLWLDVLALLPLVIAGLLKISRQESASMYIGWLTLLIIDNYYMGWMVCLFTLPFLLWQLSRQNAPASKTVFKTYLLSSLTSVALSAVVLLPTIWALTTSKGTYTTTSIKWRLEYNPLYLFGKLVPGAFNFNQMPSGQANLYLGMLPLFAGLLYFFTPTERQRSRWLAGGITGGLLLSCCWPPLDLLWHLGQFPVWYPARFSFLISFWWLWLAAVARRPHRPISWRLALLLVAIAGSGAGMAWGLRKQLDYLTPWQIGIGLLLAALAIAMLYLDQRRLSYFGVALAALTIFDLSFNAVTALNKISYVSQAQFANYTKALVKVSQQNRQTDHGLYRIAKDFARTKDDPFQGDFFTGDHFGSTMEPTVSKFFQRIGQPAGDGYVTYSNGTPVTDSFLGMKYYWQAQHQGLGPAGNVILPLVANRPDWKQAPVVSQTSAVQIRQNRWALPLAFAANARILQFNPTTLDPLSYQSQLYQTLAGQAKEPELFTVQNFDHVEFVNLPTSRQITGITVRRQKLMAPAQLTLTIKPQTNDPYYLTLGAALKDNATITLNGRPLKQYPTYQNTIVTTIADHAKGKTITVTIALKKASLWLQNVSLYRLNRARFEQSARRLQTAPLKITSWHSNRFTGTITVTKARQVLMTSIPYTRGWHVKIDGHPVATHKAAQTFLAVKLPKGTHTVSFTYWPPYWWLGLTITLLTALGWGTWQKRKA